MKFKGLMGNAFSRFEVREGKYYLDGELVPHVLKCRVVLDGDIPKVILEIPINELTTDQIEH